MAIPLHIDLQRPGPAMVAVESTGWTAMRMTGDMHTAGVMAGVVAAAVGEKDRPKVKDDAEKRLRTCLSIPKEPVFRCRCTAVVPAAAACKEIAAFDATAPYHCCTVSRHFLV